MKRTVQLPLAHSPKVSARQLGRIATAVYEMLGLEARGTEAEALTAEVLADARARRETDAGLALVRRILTERLEYPKPAADPISIGILHLVHGKADDGGRRAVSTEGGDLAGLFDRLTVGTVEFHDAVRAGSFVRFMLAVYGAAGLTDFAKALKPGVEIDVASRAATGRSVAMLELQWAESLKVDPPAKGLGQFIGWAIRFLLPYRLFITLLSAGILVQTAYAMLMPIWLNRLFDAGITPHRADMIIWMLGLLIGGFLCTSAAGVAMDFGVSNLGARSLDDLRRRVFDKLFALSSRSAGRLGSGDIVSTFASDMLVVENAIVRAVPGLVSKTLMMLGSLVTAVALDWRLALATLFLLFLAFWGPRQVAGFATKAAYARKVEDARLAGFVKETAQMLPAIRTLNLGDYRRDEFAGLREAIYRASFRQYLLGELTGRAANFGISAAQLGVIALGALLSLNGTVSAGVVVAYIGLLLAFGGSAAGIAALLPVAIQAVGGWQRIESLLRQPDEEPAGKQGVHLERPLSRVAFEDVSFSYTGDRLNLDDVSLDVAVPKRIALVGPSGSGKSTMIGLLSRNYDATDGRISLNDVDIRDLDNRTLRSLLAVVNQDTTLFDGSIRYNIRAGRLDATDDEVEQAARAAEIHDFVQGLPDGYDTEVGEGGKLLSGGQRQRIVIARALIRDPEILLLDEATSALDAEAEAAINETLARVSTDRTMFWVTHHLASCTGMDLICAFREGRLVESGTHEDLLARQGVYAGMWAKQAEIAIVNAGRKVSISIDRLRQIPLFATLSTDVLERAREMLRIDEVEAGVDLITEGSTTGRFYIIARGAVESSVRLADGQTLEMEVLEVGDTFGEFALLEGIPHPTTCRTRWPCMLLSLSQRSLNTLTAEQPELKERIVEVLDRRLDAKLEELVWRRLQ